MPLISFKKKENSYSVLQEAGRDGTLDHGAYSGYTDDRDKLGSDTPCPRTRLGGPTKIHFTVDVVYSQTSQIRGNSKLDDSQPRSLSSTVLPPAQLLSAFLRLGACVRPGEGGTKSPSLVHGHVGLVHMWKLKTDGSFILLQSRVVLKELCSSSVVTDTL